MLIDKTTLADVVSSQRHMRIRSLGLDPKTVVGETDLCSSQARSIKVEMRAYGWRLEVPQLITEPQRGFRDIVLQLGNPSFKTARYRVIIDANLFRFCNGIPLKHDLQEFRICNYRTKYDQDLMLAIGARS